MYPEPIPEVPTFLNVRNRLFHSHEQHDDLELLKETMRLEAIVKRILVRWLGWEDLWQIPQPWGRAFVAGKGHPEGEAARLIRGRPRARKKKGTKKTTR